MEDYLNEKGICSVCKEAVTETHTDLDSGRIFVCEKCIKTTKQNFIWICMQCGNVYVRPKSIVLKRLSDPEMKQAYQVCEDLQIIQGIDCCIECDPETIMTVMAAAKSEKSKWDC